jgi:hypothetical protein
MGSCVSEAGITRYAPFLCRYRRARSSSIERSARELGRCVRNRAFFIVVNGYIVTICNSKMKHLVRRPGRTAVLQLPLEALLLRGGAGVEVKPEAVYLLW